MSAGTTTCDVPWKIIIDELNINWLKKSQIQRNTFTWTCSEWACFLGNWHVLQINQFCSDLVAVGVYVVVGWGFVRKWWAGVVVFAVLNYLVFNLFFFFNVQVLQFPPFVLGTGVRSWVLKGLSHPFRSLPGESMRYNMSGLNVLKTQGR